MHRLIWAVPVGLLIGYALGLGIGYFAIWLRNHYQETTAPNDFLALALIALSYVFAEWVGAWGFLAVFAAGLGLRRAEIKTVEKNPVNEDSEILDELKSIAKHENHEKKENENRDDETNHTPAENIVEVVYEEEAMKEPAIAAGVVVSEVDLVRRHGRAHSRSFARDNCRHQFMDVLGLACRAARRRFLFYYSTARHAAFSDQNADRTDAALAARLVRHSRHRQYLLSRLRAQSRSENTGFRVDLARHFRHRTEHFYTRIVGAADSRPLRKSN